MRDALATYFGLEKVWALSIAAVGLALLGLAVWLWLARGEYRGMAVPLGVIALIEIGVGLGVGLRTDGQVAQLVAQLDASPAALASTELTRMAGVMRTFQLIKIVELVLFASGVALTYVMRSSAFAFAAGVGLVAQTSLMLLFDLFAERRAEPYVRALEQLAAAG
jgi:hypothetical protein